MTSALQIGSGMFSVRVDRGRPGCAEKRFPIPHFGERAKTGRLWAIVKLE